MEVELRHFEYDPNFKSMLGMDYWEHVTTHFALKALLAFIETKEIELPQSCRGKVTESAMILIHRLENREEKIE